jgi:fibronectin-binding autotransporter adhesin
MTQRNQLLNQTARKLPRLAASSAVALILSLLAGTDASAQVTWNGATDGNWATATNWVGGVAPVSGNAISFGGNVNTTNTNNIVGLTTGNINFTNNGTSPNNVGFTVGGNAITLGGNITTTNVTGTAITDTVSLNMVLNGSRTMTANTLHALTVSGDISETGGSFSLTKGGAAVLTLSSANNSFTGGFITNGQTSINTIANTGTNSSIGSAGDIIIGSGGTSGGQISFDAGALGGTTNRALRLNSTGTASATITNNSSSLVSFTGTITNAGTTGNTKTLTLQGSNTLANEISGVIADGTGGGVTALTKTNGGVWRVSGANTFSGVTTIAQGTLRVNDGAALGTNAEVRFSTGTSTNAGILAFDTDFTGGTITKNINLQSTSTGGGNITNNGSGALTWSGTFTAAGAAGTGNKNFVLSGTNTGNNTLSVDVTDGSGGAVVGLVKDGTGRWIISGTNTYGNPTTVREGTLVVGATTAIPGNNINFQNGNFLANTTNAVLDINGLNVGSGNTINLGTGANVNGNVSANIIDSVGGGVLTAGNITYSAGAAGLNHGASTISANLNMGGVVRTYTVADSANVSGSELTISGNISGTAGMTKAGVGTLELTGVSSYSGQTSVSNGTLVINSIKNTGVNSAIGSSGDIQVGSGATNATLIYNGAGDSSNRQFRVGGGAAVTDVGSGTILNRGTATLNLTNAAFNNAQAGATVGRTISFGGTNDIVVNGAIVNNNALAGTIGLTKIDTNKLTLTAASTYSGSTAVNAGTLEVNNTTGSGTGTGAFTLATGAILRGDGAIGSAGVVTVNGTIQVGATGATVGTDLGIGSATSSTTLAAPSIVLLDLFATTGTTNVANQAAADTVVFLGGSLTIDPAATLTFGNPNTLTFNVGDVFRVFDWTALTGGAPTGTFGTIDTSALTLGAGSSWDTSSLYTAGTISVIGVIPEPSRMLLLGLGIAGMTFRRRRRE